MKTAEISKTYGGRRVLKLPSVELEKGLIYAVIGANGSGKSTMAKILSGVELSDTKAAVLPDISVGYMPQKSFAFRMRVKANIYLAQKDEAKAEKMMQALRIEHLATERANKLSGGETARVALARLLMQRYELLVLDEPTASMDMESTILAETLIRQYCKDTGCAMLLITHSIQQARRMADRALFLHEGQLLESGEAGRVLYTPVNPKTREFLDFYGA